MVLSRKNDAPPAMELGNTPPLPSPSSAGGVGNGHGDGSMIMGSQRARVPPSPLGMRPPPGFYTVSDTPSRVVFAKLPPKDGRAVGAPKADSKLHARTGAGVKKTRSNKKVNDAVSKLAKAATGEQPVQKPFRFMDLPGEIRNIIYRHTYDIPRQALLVHRPRVASLRSRTRLDRARTLASDITGQEIDTALDVRRDRKPNKPKTGRKVRYTNRPFYGLTQVCQLVRMEFRPIYLQRQEIGMDLSTIVEYLQTFYHDAPRQFANLDALRAGKLDLPFMGNLTIAIGEKANEKETSATGIELLPLLDIWANSYKLEAGFGRYLKAGYLPERDGEAKDLYRLFGRRVQRNRSCGSMNTLWRTILRNRALISVRVHRKPSRADPVASPIRPAIPANIMAPRAIPTAPRSVVSPAAKPYFHILFKRAFAEPWMTDFNSKIPKIPDWLGDRGFGYMEHFDVKVGVLSAAEELSLSSGDE
ncbi:hypothetical protein N0V83_003188 [Neocucurbitaria cava]|uniref:F-box domain-containing protein n=1 Tax=Neocucurbitaria cava TaxID=798079 RepID=A0A9W8YB90_9PLEO|nr:hypothetical protein N0V83_003188 [Neocucurbitaria cava]